MYEKKNQGDRLMWERYHEKLTRKQEQYHEKLTQKQEQYREQLTRKQEQYREKLTQKQSVLRQKGEILSQKWWIRLFRSMWRRYRVHNVGLESAALAFYLVFAIFPFLIFVTVLLRIWELNLEGGLDLLAQILPAEITDIVRQFLRYASRPNARLLVSSLVFSFWFPMRASNALMLSVRKAYHLGTPHGAAQMLKNLFFTVVLMATVVLTVLLMTVSNRILAYAVENLFLPEIVAELWQILRFPLIACAGWLILSLLYALAQDEPQRWRNLWPGTLAALCGWMLASWLYALYVNNLAHYSLLYGSIGTVIVLLIWLNLSSMTLILGAELNGTLISLRKEYPDRHGKSKIKVRKKEEKFFREKP